MEPNQAAEHLQAIRTLMEHSAVYRRALAPVMTFCGAVGIAGGILGDDLPLHTAHGFVLFWAAVAAVVLCGSFLMVRRQALKDAEPFWSPPTRRVTRALLPGLVVGAGAGAWLMYQNPYWAACAYLVPVWCILFGLALHSAGFFMPRGLKLFGWIFMAAGGLLLVLLGGHLLNPNLVALIFQPHWLMGLTFGGLPLTYGIYLYFTEKRRPTS
jgi:hypothetical protein